MACDPQLTQAEREGGFANQNTGVTKAIRPFTGQATPENLVDYLNREVFPVLQQARAKLNEVYLQVAENAPSANPLSYYFSTETAAADPTAGRLRLNQAVQNTATVIRVSEENAQRLSTLVWLDVMAGSATVPIGAVTINDAINPRRFIRFNLDTMTDNGAYWDLGVTPIESSHPNPFVDGEAVAIGFIASVASGGVVTAPGVGAPADSEYLLGAADVDLPNGRVATDSTEIDANLTVANVISWALRTASVVFAKLQDLTGLSVLGRASNSAGVMAAITATAARQVLQVNDAGTALAWGDPLEVRDSGADQGDAFALDFVAGTNVNLAVSVASRVATVTPSVDLTSVTYTAGDGIDLAANQFSVDVTDLVGTGLEDDGANNLRIAAAAAGAGLTGGAGSALAVGAGTRITVNANDVQLATGAAETFLGNFTAGTATADYRAGSSVAGAGLTYTAGGTLAVGAGTNVTVNANDIAVTNFPLTGLATQADDTFLANISGGAAAPAAVALTTLAGAGLTGGANAVLAVGAGTGITVNANDVAVTIPLTDGDKGHIVVSASGATWLWDTTISITGSQTIATTANLTLDAGADLLASVSSGINLTVGGTASAADAGDIAFNATGGINLSAGAHTATGANTGDIALNASGGVSLLAGATPTVGATGGRIEMRADDLIFIQTNGTERLRIESDGSWLVSGSNGSAGDVLTSQGASASPIWQGILAAPIISPTSISANQNNYNPTGWSTARVARLITNNTTTRTITGMLAGAPGEVKVLHNIGAPTVNGIIQITLEDASSTAANRFARMSGTNYLLVDGGAIIWYDGTSSRWRIISGAGL